MREEMLAAAKDEEIDIHRFFCALSEETKQHSRCVAELTEELLLHANMEGLLEYESLPMPLGQIRDAVIYHDIGMVLIPERILNKAEELTALERQVIQRHTTYGAKLLDKYRSGHSYPEGEAPKWELAAEVAISHHERWDGRGYPFGLIATAVPIVSRAAALADSYASIVRGSPCRMALPHEYALLEISTNAGTQFDPDLAELFTRHEAQICQSANACST